MRSIVENPVMWLVLIGMAAAVTAAFVGVLRTITSAARRGVDGDEAPGTGSRADR